MQQIVEGSETGESELPDNDMMSQVERPSISHDIEFNDAAKDSKKTKQSKSNPEDGVVGDNDDSFEKGNQTLPKIKNNLSFNQTTNKQNISQLQALKVTQVLNETKMGFEQEPQNQKTPFEIFMTEQLVRDLINGQSIFWAIKVMDWLLIPIWASISKKDLGLGFTDIQVGEITFYSFPGVLLILLLGYGTLNVSQVDWTLYSFIVFGICVGITPLIAMFNLSLTMTLTWLVFFECIKVSCFLIYSSAWSVLMNGYINGNILGRMYSFSFMFSHFALIILFQLFPRLLSFMISNSTTKKLGFFSVWVVFIVMALPAYIGVKITIRAKKQIEERDANLQSDSSANKSSRKNSSAKETQDTKETELEARL